MTELVPDLSGLCCKSCGGEPVQGDTGLSEDEEGPVAEPEWTESFPLKFSGSEGWCSSLS